ncbi:iron-containing alcohol dehydrogenase [Dietzia aurantiaca]|uniref:Iron-containing alcohol dehydrogenase n=1 Tax=Dietzia aurantiaca TaxID=983873 RepID=A0ABV9PN73_9ACTN
MTSEARVAKFHTPEILFGFGALPEAATVALGLGARRPLVVTDPGLQRTPWPDVVLDGLRSQGARPVVWSDVCPNPRATQVLSGAETYRTAGCDVIVAVGGGSVIDAAKGVALVVSNGGHVLEYEGVDRVRLPLPPIVAVSTTAGSGADVSQFCVINDADRGTKVTIASRSLVPDVAVIDPATHATVPADANAAAAIDVLSHGVEAYFSRAAGPLTDSHALRSVALCVHALDRLAGGDAHSREQLEQMALASLEAGMAFSNAVLGAVHAMSHPVGGRYDSTHGRINGVLLPHVVRHNGETLTPGRVEDLVRAVGIPASARPTISVDRIANRFRDLADGIGLPAGLADLGVRADDIPILTEHAIADLCMATNPRPATSEDIDGLYREAS